MTKNRQPKAVLVAVASEKKRGHLVLAQTPRFMSLLDKAEKRIKKSGGIKDEEFWRVIRKKPR